MIHNHHQTISSSQHITHSLKSPFQNHFPFTHKSHMLWKHVSFTTWIIPQKYPTDDSEEIRRIKTLAIWHRWVRRHEPMAYMPQLSDQSTRRWGSFRMIHFAYFSVLFIFLSNSCCSDLFHLLVATPGCQESHSDPFWLQNPLLEYPVPVLVFIVSRFSRARWLSFPPHFPPLCCQ